MLRFATKPPKELLKFTHVPYLKHILVEHLGKLAVVEEKPITIAVMDPYDDLSKATVTHPRYATRVPHKLVEVWGCRMSGCTTGRIIDVLMEEPFEAKGKEHGILGFKGTGRKAEENDMALNPEKWYDETDGWVQPQTGDHHNRKWGFVMEQAGRDEMADPELDGIFARFQIPVTPYLSMNPLADGLLEAIVNEHGGNIDKLRTERPVQLTRALSTNVRMLMATRLFNGDTIEMIAPYLDADALLEMDKSFIRMVVELAGNSKMLTTTGQLEDNRLLDGTMMDTENLAVRPKGEIYGGLVVTADELFYSSSRILSGAKLMEYAMEMKRFIQEL
ncbi:MAG: hypothetical protein WCT31_04485, partial [Candidatus Micrarchaeia archaeon]